MTSHHITAASTKELRKERESVCERKREREREKDKK